MTSFSARLELFVLGVREPLSVSELRVSPERASGECHSVNTICVFSIQSAVD
jgi:hypothetical protein